MNMLLTELQHDAIQELLNIGMGTAAASLSEMVGEEVLLSVPSLEFYKPEQAIQQVKESAGSEIAAVRQEFFGPFWGNSLLIFPQEESLQLVRLLLQEDIPVEQLSEMEREAMTEVGNIILNACLSSLADMFSREVHTTVPSFHQGQCESVFAAIADDKSSDKDEGVMFLRMDFNVANKNIHGFVSFMMDIESLHAFRSNIDLFLGAA